MSRPRSSAATVLAKIVPTMANGDRLGENCTFLSMANGIGAKLCRTTMLHCALVLAKTVVSVRQNAEKISFGKRISFWLKSDHWFGRRPCSVRAVRETLFSLVAVLAKELPFSVWQKNYSLYPWQTSPSKGRVGGLRFTL